MRLLLILPLVLMLSCITAPLASKDWPVHFCEEIPETTASYCYDESDKIAVTVGLMFHGLGDNDQYWLKPSNGPLGSSAPALIAAMPPMRWFTISFSQPVSIPLIGSFESGWMLTKYPERKLTPEDSTIDVFKNKIMPYLETKYGIKGPYIGLGHSMGGSNLATLWAAPETSAMWKSVTILNPALAASKFDPFHLTPLLDYCPWCWMVPKNFENKSQWDAGSPLGLLKTAKFPLAPIHITACKQDVLFQMYDATLELIALANSKMEVDWHDGDPGCDHWHYNVPWVIGSLKK